jgi:hypothetical protein
MLRCTRAAVQRPLDESLMTEIIRDLPVGAQRAAGPRHVASTCATYLLSIFNNGNPETRSFSVELTEEDVSHEDIVPRFGRLTRLANLSRTRTSPSN